MQISNPLLAGRELPMFSAITPDHVGPAIDAVLERNRVALKQLGESTGGLFGWEDFVQPLNEMAADLDSVWGTVNHLNAVCSTPALRAAHEKALARVSIYLTEMAQNKTLYQGYRSLLNSHDYVQFDVAQRSVIDNELRNFKLSGVHLNAEKQHRFRELSLELSQLSSRFSNNVLDATDAWTRLVTDESELDGLPADEKTMLAQAASEAGLQGWLLSLQSPCVQAVMTYAQNRALRQEIYYHNCTRASDVNPDAASLDNSPLITEILANRVEMAQLLGYENFAELSLASKMADTVAQVTEFLRELALKSRPFAAAELEQLSIFAAGFGVTDLQPWDYGYFAQHYQKEHLQVDQDKLRPYFPADHVLKTLFDVTEQLFSVRVVELQDFESWHPDVRLFEVVDASGRLGRFYLDMYARPTKRSGAWMDGARSRRRDTQGVLQLPMAYLVCNFSPAVDGRPALLTHDDIQTLFHEFGHGLHHLLTRIDQPSVAGVNGVAWDAVELPSQFMENWCWQPEVLAKLGCHVETGEPLSDEMITHLVESQAFHAGLGTLRQVEFALFDFELHARSGVVNPVALMSEIRKEVSLIVPPEYHRFTHTFSHIFAGGYAAGYYSYKWAEVLAADAFSRFREEGLFDPGVGQDFRTIILGQGGAEPAMELFKRFRGRDPRVEALLESSGLVAAA